MLAIFRSALLSSSVNRKRISDLRVRLDQLAEFQAHDCSLLHCLRTTTYFCQFLCDCRLAGFVHSQRQSSIRSVALSVAFFMATMRMLCSDARIQHGLKNLRPDQAIGDTFEHSFDARFVQRGAGAGRDVSLGVAGWQ